MPSIQFHSLISILLLLLIVSTNSLSAIDLTLRAEAPNTLITEGASTSVEVQLKLGDSKSGTYKVKQFFTDRYGEKTEAETLSIKLSKFWKHTVEVPVKYYGPTQYHIEIYQSDEDLPVASQKLWLIRPVPVPELTDAERIASPIGINVHHGADWQALKTFGVHWVRDYSWKWLRQGKHIPKSANHTDFGKKIEAIEAADIEVLPVMAGAFRTKNKKFFLPWGDVIRDSYERLSNGFPEIIYWELDNESNLAHRDETTADYQKWLDSYVNYIRNAYLGLEKAGHGAKIALDGEAGIHPKRAKYLLEEVGDYYSVVNYHYYTGTFAPEIAEQDINTGAEDRPQTVSFLDLMRQMNRLAKEHDKEAWLSEIAWSSEGGPEVGFRLQSAYLNRIYLLGAWAGTDKTFWFWDRNIGGQGRFSGTGLMDLESKPKLSLPAGAALAAVSKFISRAKYAGSVDIGEDRWCLLFKRPEGGWLAAAWAVGTTKYPLPSSLAKASEAFGMYGNPLRDRQLSDEPSYFYLQELPATWDAQRNVQWVSSSTVNVYQNGEATLEAAAGPDVTFRLENMPEGASVGDWSYDDQGMWKTKLSVSPTLPQGSYDTRVVTSGDGWSKTFPIRIEVQLPLSIITSPYTPGKSSEITATLLIPGSTEANFRVDAKGWNLSSNHLTLQKDESGSINFTAPKGARGPFELTMSLDNGIKQTAWIRPRYLHVPRAGNIHIDGNLDDWPQKEGILGAKSLLLRGLDTSFTPEMHVAWSPEGLYVASRMPVGEEMMPPTKPQDFWEWTGMEMNINAADTATEPGKVRSHLLYFVPTKTGDSQSWSVFAGEWNKLMPDGKKEHLIDDKRTKNAVSYENGIMTIEVFIPEEVLEAAPQAGHKWRMTMNSKISRALSPKTVAAWPAGPGKGWDAWGLVVFEE